MTAQRVAARRLAFDRVPGPGRPLDDERLARDVASGASAPAGPLHEYLRARTDFVDRTLVGALDDGVTQVVLVGAGYDGRAWRYARRGVRFFEVDHPATQADKRARCSRLGLDVAAVAFVPVDVGRDPLVRALGGAGFDASRRALFVVEGLCAYLDVAVVAALFADLRALAAPGSELAVTVGVEETEDPEVAARRAALRRRVAALGEPIRSELPTPAAVELLGSRGWHVAAPALRTHDAAMGLLVAVACDPS